MHYLPRHSYHFYVFSLKTTCAKRPGKDADIVDAINAPALKTLFRNLLKDIPTTTDLTEINTETAVALESALSVMQQVREKEGGQVVEELEAFVDRVHTVSGEYRS
jgi:uncharacterized protein YicC (UPF0701 family)